MPLTGYGEITLIGDKRMVDPLRGTRTFGADIYSARYPELAYTISKQGEKVIQQAVEILPVELQGDVWRGIEQAAEKGKKGIVYKKRSGVCLETQHYPDSPNKPDWPSVILEPGKVYNSRCIYKFVVEK